MAKMLKENKLLIILIKMWPSFIVRVRKSIVLWAQSDTIKPMN